MVIGNGGLAFGAMKFAASASSAERTKQTVLRAFPALIFELLQFAGNVAIHAQPQFKYRITPISTPTPTNTQMLFAFRHIMLRSPNR